MSEKIKIQKIFLNAMDSWFSNFVIETFRTDHLPESKSQTEFMGTFNDKKTQRLPMYFKPKIINFEYNTAYENIIFSNDIIIYNLNTGNTKELEYIINGLNSQNFTTEKILIIISNIMTWSKTPDKIKTDESTDDIIFIHPDDIKKEIPKENSEENLEEKNNNNEEVNNNLEENKENINLENNNENESKEEKNTIKDETSKILSNKTLTEKIEEENKKVIVYYTEKDYLQRRPNSKYMQYKYVENEALSLNQKKNIKAYVICPGFIYGYGEKTFYSFFRNAILNIPIEEILLDKGRNIIPTIHMKDLINIISKIIEKKPNSYYILAFDQTKNNSLLSIAKSIYDIVGDINKMIPPKEETIENNENEENNNNENINNEEQKEKSVNASNNNEENKNNSEDNSITNKDEENNENNDNNNILPQKKKISFFSNKKFNISKDFPRDLLYLDIKLLASEFIKGEPKKNLFINESDEENNLKPKNENIEYTPLFKWHSPFGIISNPNSIRKEFIKYRNLSSNAVLILGNPYVGKTELSTIISKIFHLPLINIKMISDYGKSIAGINNNENSNNNINENNTEINNYRKNSIEKDLIRDIQKVMKELDENRAIAEENYNKRKDKKKNDPPFDDNMYYRFDDEMLVRILDRRLQQNDTVLYGYILDGFPKNSKQAEELMDNFEKNGTIPNSIIIFDNVEDDFLINRIKSGDKFPKDPKDPQANVILERVNRRLGKIKENKTQNKEYIDLVDFFKNSEKYKDKVLYLDTKKELIDLVKEAQEYIIKNNNNKINQTDEMLNCTDYLYDYIKEQELKKQKEEEELLKQQQLEENKNSPAEIKEEKNIEEKPEEKNEENKEKEEKENNEEELKEENNETKNEDEDINEENKEEEEIKTKEEIEKENVYKLLEKKSEVLRRYLSENVLPLLSLGILQIATERPDDPVEALADFLLDKTLELEKKEMENKNKNKKEETITSKDK